MPQTLPSVRLLQRITIFSSTCTRVLEPTRWLWSHGQMSSDSHSYGHSSMHNKITMDGNTHQLITTSFCQPTEKWDISTLHVWRTKFELLISRFCRQNVIAGQEVICSNNCSRSRGKQVRTYESTWKNLILR